MSKFTYALLSVVVIEFALYLFGGTTYGNSTVLSLILNPDASNALWIGAVALLATAAVGIVASAFFQINTFGVYAVFGTTALTFGYTIFNLFKFVNGQLSDIGVQSAMQISSIIIAPILIFYLVSIVEWARSNT
jgi:hypothetical protein